MMRQLAFRFTPEPALDAANFFVSACNHEAHAWVTRWPEWPAHGLIITGPEGAGKTHLTHIWRARAQALLLAPALLDAAFTPDVLGGAAHVAVDGADGAPSPQALFHLLNWVREHSGSLLLTSALPVKAWPFTLADLRSRLAALPASSLGAPDDTLLAALLMKQFSDRQLCVNAAAVDYLVRHMDRSFAGVAATVAALDDAALLQGRAITPALARHVLEALKNL